MTECLREKKQLHRSSTDPFQRTDPACLANPTLHTLLTTNISLAACAFQTFLRLRGV